MKTNVKTMLMALVATSMVACSNNQDVFHGGAIEKTAKQSYAENFAKKYPNVDMNQNWDFSSKTPYFSFSNNNGNHAGTRAAVSYDFTEGAKQEVDLSTVEWMKDNLKEGKPNRSLGKAFYMTVPGTEFTIQPIFQGEAGAVWDLHVVVNGVDILLWTKSQDIELQTEVKSEWHSVVDEQAAEGWNSNSGWTIQYQKTCTLPAGDYVLKVAARSSANTTSTCSMSSEVAMEVICGYLVWITNWWNRTATCRRESKHTRKKTRIRSWTMASG